MYQLMYIDNYIWCKYCKRMIRIYKMIRTYKMLDKIIISNRRWHARLCNFMELMQSHRRLSNFTFMHCCVAMFISAFVMFTVLWTKVSNYRFCSVSGYDMSPFIRRYAKYLNEKALSYRTVAFDFCKVKRGYVCKEHFFSRPLEILCRCI